MKEKILQILKNVPAKMSYEELIKVCVDDGLLPSDLLRCYYEMFYELIDKIFDVLDDDKGNVDPKDCISKKDLIKRINNAEDEFVADHMEVIGTDEQDPFVDGVLSGVWSVRTMVQEAPCVYIKETEDAKKENNSGTNEATD